MSRRALRWAVGPGRAWGRHLLRCSAPIPYAHHGLVQDRPPSETNTGKIQGERPPDLPQRACDSGTGNARPPTGLPGGYFGVKSIASVTRVNGILAVSFTCFTRSALDASNRHMQWDSPGTNVLRMYRTALPCAVNFLLVSIAAFWAAASCSIVTPGRLRSTM